MIGEIVKENFRNIAVLGGIIAVFYGATDAQPPSGVSIPEWTPLFGVIAICGAIGILFASGKIEDMWPEDHGIYLAVVKARTETRAKTVVEVWELTEDDWADLKVVDGPLNELPDTKHRAYECYAYNEDSNTAVGNWKETVPASQIIGHKDISDAMDDIQELRNHLEPMAKRGRYIRHNLTGILRELDRQRAENQARALEPSIAPSFGGESVSDAIERCLPSELQPSRIADNEDVEETDDSDGLQFEILDESLDEPLAPKNGANGHE